MTQDETERLIAEIKNKAQISDMSIQQVEKIIKHFANKPPYMSQINFSWASPMIFTLYIDSNHNKDCSLAIEYDGKREGVAISIEELTQLRDNCNKMLEYLNDSKV